MQLVWLQLPSGLVLWRVLSRSDTQDGAISAITFG